MLTPGSPRYGSYENERLDRVAFPLGGIGTGMICVEGSGAFGSVSLRHHPDILNVPLLFSAISVKGRDGAANTARVLSGRVPGYKIMFPWGPNFDSSGNGAGGRDFGLPHFEHARFTSRFPFAEISLQDRSVPLDITISAWNPFIPNEVDDSSLPVAGLEYQFTNNTSSPVDAVFSHHARNFLAPVVPGEGSRVTRTERGFILRQGGTAEKPWEEGHFSAWLDDSAVQVNPAWFRGGWFDAATMVWKTVQNAESPDAPECVGKPSPGGSLYRDFRLEPGESRTITLKWAWYVPFSDVRWEGPEGVYHRPWYAGAFASVEAVESYWRTHYDELKLKTETFTRAFYDSTLPPEVIDAVAANLTILKSPTVLRQEDGRMWAWEGCNDARGSCHGTCTHVWNYAQAVPHLFAELERGLRETEFLVSQDDRGHQNFRTPIPISPSSNHTFPAAADGQLGGILKVYRDWRICGDLAWLRKLWPRVRASLDFCIQEWDPRHQGLPSEPHHNTYDIEFWGENGMCGSFYLGALAAASAMATALGESCPLYAKLLSAGREHLETRLFNGEYFYQNIRWTGLEAKDPTATAGVNVGQGYTPEALALLEREGPKYQYGEGCLSDGVIGAWMGWASGLAPFLDEALVGKHLEAVYRYNFREDLSAHANPQRSTYALGAEAGLLLCTWPRGNRLSLPLPYSEEVWTGIEYQVASHLISMGRVEEGLAIVRAVRDRYDGRVRNPFNEYECGHWYARAMASYALLQALSGARYDAVERTLYITPPLPGDFRSFLSTATGFGVVGVRGGEPFLEVKYGQIAVDKIEYRA